MFVSRRAALALLAVLPAASRAQGGAWNPAGPVRVVVPQPPGASMDLVARQLAQVLQADFGQPVAVENRTARAPWSAPRPWPAPRRTATPS